MSRSSKSVGQQSLSPKEKKESRLRPRSNKADLLPGSQLRDEAVTGPPVVFGYLPPTESRLSGFEKEKEEGVEAKLKRSQRLL